MAINPIQYTQPTTFGLREGLAIGQTIQNIRESRARREQEEIARQRSEEFKKQYNADLQEAWNSPNKVMAFTKLSTKYPQQADAFKNVMSGLSEEQLKNELSVTGQVYAALDSGNVNLATGILDERIEARKNSGQDASKLQMLRNNIEKDPQNGLNYAAFALSSLDPKKFAEQFGKLGEERREKEKQPGVLEKQAADIGLTKAQTKKALADADKLTYETKKALIELEGATDKGAITDPEKRFNVEKKLRDELYQKTKDISDSEDAFRKIEVSADDKTGAGDIALVTSFMKMLDPGSVVRETEFATARDTAGLYTQLKNWSESKTSGAFLSPSQRRTFKDLSKKYLEAAQKSEKKVRKQIDANIKNYGLNKDNIYGVEEEAEPEKTVVESRTTPDGKTIVRYSDGSMGIQ